MKNAREDQEFIAKEKEQQMNYKKNKRKDPEFLEKERESDEQRRKNIKIQKQLNSMYHQKDQDFDDGFIKDYLYASKNCNIDRI